jgi:hypothetical protein
MMVLVGAVHISQLHVVVRHRISDTALVDSVLAVDTWTPIDAKSQCPGPESATLKIRA